MVSRAPGLTRRRMMRWTAAGAGALLWGGSAAGAAAAPTRAAAAPVVVTYLPWGGWPAYAGAHWQQFIAHGIAHFEASHPGLRVQVGAPQGGNTNILSAILAGVGPDVFEDWVMSPYLEAGVALNLRPFLEQDNIPLSSWSPGQMRTMMTDTGIWALPCYVHGDVVAINLSMLDQLGLKYPDPDWDYTEAERLARAAVSTHQKTKIYGWCPAGFTPWAAEFAWPFHLWGGAIRDTARTRCTANEPNAYKGLEWYMNLYFDKVLYPGGDYPTSPGSIYNTSGSISVFQEIGSNSVPVQLQYWRDNIKWTYWPMPHFPGGQASFEADDFYMANAGTKNVEATWELLKFVTADPWWQRFNFQYLLRTPGMVGMWDEWVRYIENVSPVARGKNLSAYRDAALYYAVAPRYFKYDDSVVEPILTQAVDHAMAHQGGLVELLNAAAQRITQHESLAAATAGKAGVELASLNATIAAALRAGGDVTFPAPPVTGLGSAPVPAPKGAVTAQHGVYTILGSGKQLGGSTSDDFTFACLPWRKGKGTFTCRLTAVSNVKGGQMAGNTKIGLMARGDLSSEGAFVGVVVAVGHGVQVPERALAAGTTGDQGQGNTSNLIGATGLLQPLNKALPNYLLKPVWLRLVQDVNRWSAFASLDGVSWQQQGVTDGIEATSVWVGLFVAPAGAPQAQAVFDNVSFTPTAFYQVGG